MLEKTWLSGKSLPEPPLDSFVGRKQEAFTVEGLLSATRLLTLTGAAGCGKSRLALQVVANLSERFAHGVWWVELARLTNLVWMPQVIATTLEQNESSDHVSAESLVEKLQSRELLLVLDNCEHLVAMCSPFVEMLLRACPKLRILVTSREVLNIAGETIWPVSPLSVPGPQDPLSLEEMMHYEAVQLFVERATAVQPAFKLTKENACAITRICQRLDGIPLALEMAATRLRVLSVEQIAARLENCCQLLAASYRTALPHHQSLRAAMDWSYDLLSLRERRLLLQLSVFMGGFTLETVEETCGGDSIDNIAEATFLDVLSGLVNKSLVVVERRGKEIHYRLLEMLRQYAQTRLCEAEKTERSVMRHQDRYLTLVERVPPQQLRLFGFGSVRICQDTHTFTSTDWSYAKARELLFYLLCNHSRTKEQIGLALWPDTSSSQLRSSFHSALHHLRKVLGKAEWILFKHDLYYFNRSLDYWFDVEVFEAHIVQAQKMQIQAPMRAIHHLEEGIRLYQGDFLEGTAMGDWYLPRQRELKKLYLNALLTLGRLLFTEGQYIQATNIYHRLIEHDSLQEIAHRELMRCYARQGERSQALRHYQVLAELLRDELQAFPAPETVDLVERLRNGEVI